MDIKKFIGKVVIEKESGKRFILKEITSPYIAVKEENNINAGISIVYDTINGDPIKRGVLEFEDKTLTAQFLATYDEYCHTQDAYYEEIGYWMRKD